MCRLLYYLRADAVHSVCSYVLPVLLYSGGPESKNAVGKCGLLGKLIE